MDRIQLADRLKVCATALLAIMTEHVEEADADTFDSYLTMMSVQGQLRDPVLGPTLYQERGDEVVYSQLNYRQDLFVSTRFFLFLIRSSMEWS